MKHTRITDARAKLAASPGAGNFLLTEKVLQCVNPQRLRGDYGYNPIKVLEISSQVPEPATFADCLGV